MNRLIFALGLFVATASFAQETPKVPKGELTMVSMRDGVSLATTVYLPEGDGPWPVIISRTPYNQARSNRRAPRYLDQAYAYVTQDMRGKFKSEGVYEPYQPDIEDGYDTIEWIAEQQWCNGKVGISGRSAAGIAANLAAASAPPHLVCAYIVTAPESLHDESYFMGGIFREHFRGNFMRLTGAEDQIPILKARAVLDQQWLATDLVFHRHNINIPMYNVGGWLDMFAKGAINNFVTLQYHGRPGAKGNQKLWMGPWGHSKNDGDLEFVGERGLSGGFAEEMRWFDHWLKEIDTGIMDEPAVTYYHMASARKGKFSSKGGLRTSNDWPPVGVRDVRYYASSSSENATGTLTLRRPTAITDATSYVFDPSNPVPTYGGANYNNAPKDFPITVGPVDQRIIPERQDYLRFQTPPLEDDVTIQGRISLELWVSTDVPDTDFMVKLVDVYPDGYEALLLDTALRTRYRDGRRPEDVALMKPGQPTLLTLDFWSLSQTFERGHRIALHVTSSSHPRFEINPNTGEAPGLSTMQPRIARNTIHHEADHPTALVLPISSLP